MEGPVSPAELVEILQRTMEEQGLAFGSGRAREQEKLRADRRLREEQDVAYIASLQIDEVHFCLLYYLLYICSYQEKAEDQTSSLTSFRRKRNSRT